MPRRTPLARSLAADAVVHIPRAAGHALCPPGTLNGTREVVAFAQETTRSVDIEQRKQKANKPFMLKLLPSAPLTLESPLLSLGLRREIVASTAAYLGLVPILTRCLFQREKNRQRGTINSTKPSTESDHGHVANWAAYNQALVRRGDVRRCCTNRPWPARCQSTGSSPADAIRHWSAEGGHPIEDLTADDGMCCNFPKAARERLVELAGLRLMPPPRTSC